MPISKKLAERMSAGRNVALDAPTLAAIQSDGLDHRVICIAITIPSAPEANE